MKAKIINKDLEDYERLFGVRRMNFDQAVINYPTGDGLKVFSLEDLELISENKIDEFLLNNKEFLKIKLKRGISVSFYNALLNSIEDEIDERVVHLNVLRDKYKINKRGIWDKEILLFVNNKFAIEVNSSGQNFKRDGYNIIINKISKQDFLNTCCNEITNIEKEIDCKNKMLSSFGEAITSIKEHYESDKKLLI
ncbi:hypothetical protein [Clostridium uliginosum]|uniref:Uncharacterized protein n=1 Tax=Clostridium uliginosum TaxID=119641 RepID=A0A1I1QCT2_9CLOT|nr:hypothetical protein [Clostridium uliginosum]SFD19782.1 hypothetical protein SAMN05421842_12442 [Clostridium uliginosum]